jgi:hypothetical protein
LMKVDAYKGKNLGSGEAREEKEEITMKVW